MKAVVYGSVGIDVTYTLPALPPLGADLAAPPPRFDAGGPAATISLALAGWGLDVVAAGPRFGSGPLAEWIRGELAQAGVALAEVEGAPGSAPPIVIVMVTPDGERTMLGRDYADVQWTRLSPSVWEGVSVAVFDRYSGDAGAAAMDAAVAGGIPVVGDEVEGAAASMASLVIWSEVDHTTGEAAQLARTGPAVVLTAGAEPLRLFRNSEVAIVSPPEVEVVDSTGAGDVFAAACAAGLATGVDVAAAVARAADVAARYVGLPRSAGFPDL